jgi:hypothetical protein
MTDSSNQKDSEPRQSERDACASSTTSEPIQLELFERWTGDRWTQETPDESKPSRVFILPPSSTLAAESKPSDSSPPSKEDARGDD